MLRSSAMVCINTERTCASIFIRFKLCDPEPLPLLPARTAPSPATPASCSMFCRRSRTSARIQDVPVSSAPCRMRSSRDESESADMFLRTCTQPPTVKKVTTNTQIHWSIRDESQIDKRTCPRDKSISKPIIPPKNSQIL